MKRVIVLLSALTCVLAVYLSGQSAAQLRSPALALTFTKVGVVNMGVVFAQYDRVRMLKLELETEAEPFKEKKAELDKILTEWKAIAASSDPRFSSQTKQMAAAVLIETARQLEDLEIQFKAEFGKKLEDQMIELNKDIQEIVQSHAKAHGYHLILAYGEPEVPLKPLVQFQRQMKVIDAGGITRIYSQPDIDVSAEVVKTLNRKYQRSR